MIAIDLDLYHAMNNLDLYYRNIEKDYEYDDKYDLMLKKIIDVGEIKNVNTFLYLIIFYYKNTQTANNYE